jgi:hypothetical protein
MLHPPPADRCLPDDHQSHKAGKMPCSSADHQAEDAPADER